MKGVYNNASAYASRKGPEGDIVEQPKVRTFDLNVSAISDLGPSMRRITFTGEQLDYFGTEGESATLDLRIKVMIPSPGSALPDLGAMMREQADGSWYRSWLSLPETERGFMRTYTVRSLRREDRELDVDFVLHSAHGANGPAGTWAQNACVGDPMLVIGPNLLGESRGGIEFAPGEARNLLLAGDETALPAIGAILEQLCADRDGGEESPGYGEPADSEDFSGNVYLEVPTSEDFQDLEAPENVRIHWIARGPERGPGDLLVSQVREGFGECLDTLEEVFDEIQDIDIDKELLWETPERLGAHPTQGLYAWIAGEAAFVKELRRFLVSEKGVDRKQVAFMGYWRRGKAEL